MRLFWAAGAAALAIWSATPGIVNAEPMDDGNLAIGVGIICNTPEQMDRLVGLRNDGKEMVPAVICRERRSQRSARLRRRRRGIHVG